MSETPDQTGPAGPRRQAAARWLMAGLALVVAIGLGPAILDGIDAQYPWRSAVLAHAAPAELRLELGGTASARQQAQIEAALATLPAGLTRLVQQHGATIELTSLADLNRQFPSRDELSHNAGVYDPKEHVLYVAADANRNGRTALHEYGHLVDDALGHPSDSSAFAPVVDEAQAQKRLRRYYVARPAETFAELFARYYFSDRTRARLRREHPRGFEYFRALEARYIEQ